MFQDFNEVRKFAKTNLRSHFKLFIASFFILPALFIVNNVAASSITVVVDTSDMLMNLAPKTTAGDFSKSKNGSIAVTATGGYTLSIASVNGSTSLTSGVNNILSISSNVTEAAFSNASYTGYNDHWGYKPSQYVTSDGTTSTVIDNTGANAVFRRIPDSNGEILDINESPSGTKNYTLAIGARANLDTPKGSYLSDTFVIAAVGIQKCNPEATTISEAGCMQDMNDSVANSMVMNQQYQLIDERDDKVYYVAKMKDGRVWMTQNLDLDLISDTTAENYRPLTSENTDLTTFGSQGYTTANGYSCSNAATTTNCTGTDEVITWVPANTTIAKSAGSSWVNDNNIPYSYDYEDYYYYTNTSGSNTAYETKEACTAAHNDGTCPHYHTGNYYNFTAAVASNSTSTITNRTIMSNSVCPAGWKLPTANVTPYESYGEADYYSEFNHTWRAQGIIDALVSIGNAAPYNTNGYLNISNAPLYMARVGAKTYPGSNPSMGGSYNYYQTNTSNSTSNMFAGLFGTSSANPSQVYTSRYYGNSIRCVAKQNNTGSTTITFNKNASDATGTMASQTYNAYTLHTLPANTFVRSGYAFKSWNTKADGSGDSFADAYRYVSMVGTANHNITLYAQWDPVWTITFNANGGSGSNYTQDMVRNTTDYLAGNHFTRTGYYFKGWGTSSSTTTVTYRAGQAISPSGNMTLYAVWGNSTNTSLYDIIASLNNSRTLDNTSVNGSGLSAKAGMKASTITKENSGVFTYDSSIFGTSSDAANTSTIYLYRGILDDNLDGTSNTYGSNGDGANYPNYVKLGNTCWRIVRTTGSGGVKMIYNGLYSGGTTVNSCANATTSAQVTTQPFALKGNSAQSQWYRNVNRVGYTFNNDSSIQDSTTSTSVDTVFGSDANPSINNTRSQIKTYIEDTWYTSANGIANFTSLLEASAGYCNDRSVYQSYNTTTTPLTSITPYVSSSTSAYFGAYGRNLVGNNLTPSLNCSRSTVDLYRYVENSTGVSNQLKYPAALLTADEASFAGSGAHASYGSAYHDNSFLRSGSNYHLFTPAYGSYGSSTTYFSSGGASITYSGASNSYGVRPVISLKSGVTPASGSGTATDPWVIEGKTYMQDFTASQCQARASSASLTVYDRRDESDYTVRYINGVCWMTQNLRITGAISATDSNFSGANFNTAAGGDLRGSSISFTDAQSHQADSTDVASAPSGYTTDMLGAWYNYCAASAGQVCSQTQIDATQDICPANWHLPSYYQQVDAKSYPSQYSPIYGGSYYAGTIRNPTTYSYWWSATAYNTNAQYHLFYHDDSLASNARSKAYGHYVRCVRST
ncbi:MAG: InlB B-repeat-containing protein [Candidatus Saccharibacteria bacterium]|nr:InlB B-repeat-containing protein [Candidatus Saccharibacteria bacterium]